MVNVFVFIFLFALIAGVAGFIKPQWLKLGSRTKVLWVCGGIALTAFIGVGITAPPKKADSENVIDKSIGETATTSTLAVTVPIVTDSARSSATSTTTNTPEAAKLLVSQEVVQQKPTESVAIFYTVTQVVDGDTLKINLNGKSETLRLIGMDTPETVDPRKPVQCFGKESSNKAKELLGGKKISIELDLTQGDRDKYGRLLVYVRRDDGLFYNKYMIEQGYSHEYTYNLPYKYQAEFKAAQKAAQEAGRGLWSPSACNGDTTQSASNPVLTTQIQNAPTSGEQVTTQPAQTGGKFYTSSHYTATRYYPESCDGWKSLSTKYLKVFNSLNALLTEYPNRTLSPQCN